MKRREKNESLMRGMNATSLHLTPVTEAEAVKAALAAKRVTGEFEPYVEMLGLVDYIGTDKQHGAVPEKQVIRKASDIWVRESEP